MGDKLPSDRISLQKSYPPVYSNCFNNSEITHNMLFRLLSNEQKDQKNKNTDNLQHSQGCLCSEAQSV